LQVYAWGDCDDSTEFHIFMGKYRFFGDQLQYAFINLLMQGKCCNNMIFLQYTWKTLPSGDDLCYKYQCRVIWFTWYLPFQAGLWYTANPLWCLQPLCPLDANFTESVWRRMSTFVASFHCNG
jgi:hypothetical protein